MFEESPLSAPLAALRFEKLSIKCQEVRCLVSEDYQSLKVPFVFPETCDNVKLLVVGKETDDHDNGSSHFQIERRGETPVWKKFGASVRLRLVTRHREILRIWPLATL